MNTFETIYQVKTVLHIEGTSQQTGLLEIVLAISINISLWLEVKGYFLVPMTRTVDFLAVRAEQKN